ncbi:hypothetical protein CBS63078_5174 [Aspergillus niger]|uniref:Eukaryotic glutathione synthase, ATP binding domain family protein n=2 Tax=Aspergillus niger TaxID=5061 RepID=A0A254TVY0_ASPNG|nr:hypothetical protein ASPNIDRAFT_35452 [Aspergillus niger ATCC 1015]KAI2827871.1 hypothetical protein CBS133816_6132 [Aspergillus niger]KAI2864057.1 hypothetical protein CBS12448_3338 [Aspergillus niger]KAI2887998.1 hypothetical protein CBS13152_6466 [Aspergillus niger]KAI2905720.1 hypothetical protein CBS63078_5174 [Aspergillus niger]
MSFISKKISFSTPLEDVTSPTENTGNQGREGGRQDTRGATRSGYPYFNPVQAISYPSPYNPNDSTFWRDAGVNKYTALHSHPVHPIRIPRGYTQNVGAGVELYSPQETRASHEPPLMPRQQYIERLPAPGAGTHTPTTTLVRAGELTITLSEPVSPPRASISRNNSMPEATEDGKASGRHPPRSFSLQPLRGHPAENNSHGPPTTFDEIFPPVSHDGDRTSNTSAPTAFSIRGMLQKTRGAEKSSRGPTDKSKLRSSGSGAGKTVFKGRKSRKNAGNPMTSLGAISTPTAVPTPSLLQQLGRKYIELSPSQDTPAYLQQTVSTPMEPATPDSPSLHAQPAAFATRSKNAMTGHHETMTMPRLVLSRSTELRRPESNATSDAGVQTGPSANGLVGTCAQFDALSGAVCRKVREAETSVQRDQYLKKALEVQKLLVDYQRLGEIVEDTSKFLNQKMMERESIEAKLRAMMEES